MMMAAQGGIPLRFSHCSTGLRPMTMNMASRMGARIDLAYLMP